MQIKYTLNSFHTPSAVIADMVETFMKTALPLPPGNFPNYPAIPTTIPQTQSEREKELVQIKRFLVEAGAFIERATSWKNDMEKLIAAGASFSLSSPTMTDQEIDKIMESIIPSLSVALSRRGQNVIDQFDVQLRAYLNRINEAKSRIDQLQRS